MRKRKRDWPQRVYQFWCRPTGSLPQAFWDRARRMQQTWNALIPLYQLCRTEAKELEGEEKKARWKQYDVDADAVIAASGLGWEDGPFLLDRFKAACKLKGEMRPKTRLDQMIFLHRFTGGGAPVAQLLSERAKRIQLGTVPAFAYEDNRRSSRDRRFTRFWWGLPELEDALSFDVILHREIPQSAIVKRALLSGRLHPIGNWEWSVSITVEESPLSAGLDLGWRSMAEGRYLRIGYLVDSEGRRIELRLPMDHVQADAKRMAQFHADRRHTGYLRHATFMDADDLASLIGDGVEDCKGKLKRLLETLPPGFVQMRQRGLYELRGKVEELSDNPAQQAAIRAALDAWSDRNQLLKDLKITASDKAIRWRRSMYRNLAAWLTKTYEAIAWEGDLSLKEMAEAENKAPAIDASMKYRQRAALSEFRLYLQQAAAKNNCDLVNVEAAGSTSSWFPTGEEVSVSGSLFLTGPNGESRDMDENAALNLLSQSPWGIGQNGGLRTFAQEKPRQPLEIPAMLRAVAVPCPPE